jgi:putative oxidoreductase
VDELLLVGRILFAVLFVFSGIGGHFQQHRMLVEYARQAKVPLAGPAVAVSGAMIVAGGLGVALGVWADLASLLIVAFLIPVALFMHRFWGVDPQTAQMQMPHFLKNLALAGVALVFFYLFREGGDAVPYTLTGPLF